MTHLKKRKPHLKRKKPHLKLGYGVLGLGSVLGLRIKEKDLFYLHENVFVLNVSGLNLMRVIV